MHDPRMMGYLYEEANEQQYYRSWDIRIPVNRILCAEERHTTVAGRAIFDRS